MDRTKRNQTDKFALFFIDILQGPIITYDVGWADCIPQRIKELITKERLIAGMLNENLATLPEVAAYLITRTFLAPMDNDWTQIYTYVSCTVCEQHFNEDHWNEVCPDKKLNDYQQGLLLKLRRFIYDKRIAVTKKKMKLGEQQRPKVSRFINEPYNL
jgi:hypothetical protein